MSITNEKLQTIKDNVSKVYHSGQMDVIQNANSLKGFESSKAMLLDDVSPVEHEMEVKVHGKNLFNLENRQQMNLGAFDNTTQRNFVENSFYFKITANNYYNHTSTGFEILGSNSFTITSTNAYGLGVNFKVKSNEIYTISYNVSDSEHSRISVGYYDKDGNCIKSSYAVSTFTIPDNCEWMVLCFCVNSDGSAYTLTFSNIQIEYGLSATTYEAYNSDIQNVYSKNLLPFPYTGLQNVGVTEETNGVKFTLNEDGSVLIDGTAETGTVKYLYQNTKDLLGLKSGDVITGSKYVSDSSQLSNFNLTFNYYDSTTKMKDGMTLGSVTNKTTTITDDYVGWGIYFYIPSGKTISNLLVKPQLEYGSTATYYEKYHEPYPLIVKELGKNLFNVNDYTSDYQYKDGIFSGNNKVSSKEYIYMDITNVWKIAYNSNLPITISFDLKSEIDGEIAVYTLGEYRINFNSSGGNLKVATTTEWQHFDITSSKIYFTTGTTGDYCHLSFYGVYGSGVIPSVKNLQIYLGDTIISEYEDYITPKEYIPTTDGIINGVTNLYPNTTLVSNGDRVYIDCNYYKDIDKAYNKLSAAIALSEGE